MSEADDRGLPDGWAWTPLGNVAEIKLGKMLSQAAFEPRLTQREYLRNQNVRWFGFDVGDIKSMGFDDNETERFSVRAGDLLVCEGGEPGRCAVVPDHLDGMMYQKALHRVRPRPGVLDARFLQYLMRHFVDSGTVLPRMSETTIRHLTLEKMTRVPVPIPPPGEQERIVAAIDELLSQLDAGVAALERVQANLKRYRAAVLKAAVEGRLTAQWRAEQTEAEPAAVLLERILADRRRHWEAEQLAKYEAQGKRPPQGWESKYQEPEPPDTTDLPELPEGWTVASLGQLTSATRVICYGILMPKKNTPGGVPYVEVADMRGDRIEPSEVKRTAPEIAAEYERSKLVQGDLLLAIRGTLGRVAVVPPELDQGNVSRDVARLAMSERLDVAYVSVCLRSPLLQHYFARVARGVAVQGVNIGDLRPAPVLLPPADEQAAILSEVDRILSVVEEVDAETQLDLQRAARLRQSILKQAFEGKLVPQDPNDEPAEVLLSRIAAERGQAQPKARRPRQRP